MISDLDIFAKRLKQARVLRKYSMDQLVHLIGGLVSKQAISKYESAQMKPNSTVLIALAEALDVEPDYFFRPFAFDMDKLNISFRKKADTGAKDVNALKVQIQDEIERYLEVEEILGKKNEMRFTSPGGCISNSEKMRELASEVRNEWNLGIDAIANVQDVLESKGIKVITTEAPMGFDGVSGVVNDSIYIVVLNKNQKHVERRRFTTLHELGHLLYNDKFAPELSKYERERLCDSFASEMLLPSVALKQMFSPGEKISGLELRRIQLIYGISVDAIMHKLHEIGIVGNNGYRSFCIRKNKNTDFKKFVEESCYKENVSNRFETLVYAAVAKDLITSSKAASLLNSTVSSVRKHLNVIG